MINRTNRTNRGLRAARALAFAALTFVTAGATGASAAQQSRLQTPDRPQAAPSRERGKPGVIASPEEDYRIGPGDVIEVQVEDAPELSRVFRVTSTGSIVMPFLGRLSVGQKTTEELRKAVEDGLRGEYLIDPKVSVTVKEYNSRSFFIQGAVRDPGVYQIEGHASLLELITVAGGLGDKHGTLAYILRKQKQAQENQGRASASPPETDSAPAEKAGEPEPQYELITVNIGGLLKGRFDQNIPIKPGDIVNIPPADVFFVAGEVREPGSFPLKEGTTLRQAISLAQGTTFKAATNRAIIFREDPASGKREEISVDISAVMSGKKPDVPILANDIVLVPNSRLKSVTGTVLSAFGVNAWRFPRGM
ncbi:MAG TPA: polysaccharide biosynthesis/export family protein [Blastocatellia bacterium]|nr:polysaccharide biosynthesis/export family protein [Blastocatellia bacterium]